MEIFSEVLGTYAYHVNNTQLSFLLMGIKNLMPELDLPVDGRTLLGTSFINVTIVPLRTCNNSEGTFTYFRMKHTLINGMFKRTSCSK